MGNAMTLKTVREAAETLSLSVSALNKWRVEGRGPRFVRLGGRVRYRDEDIESFITAGIRESTSQTEAA